MTVIDRKKYAELYGPTVGDGVRLADTNIVISPTKDYCVGGDEAVFGGGKVIRESMGMSHRTREFTPDLVIVGALILDAREIIKADVGIKDGRIAGIGKSGNPDIMDSVHPNLVIGPSTEVISGFGKILTVGAIDCHVHFICPETVTTSLSSGVTTLIGGGTGPAEGTKATTVTPGKFNLAFMLKALDSFPVNTLLLGKGNTVNEKSLIEQLEAGSCGFKIHEDWGATPAIIDKCLTVSLKAGVTTAIHTDTLNEAGYLESTLAAINGRPIHTYHTEGAGGGHAPDIIKVAGFPNVLPSSTNPTRPFSVNTVEEHLDMLMVCHHLNSAIREDLSFAESRIRPSTIAAEDYLHDIGAISMIGSDSQAMGRAGEVILRTWQTAHVMKEKVGDLSSGEPFDNFRARRYVAKYTICPAICHGLDDEIGSVEVGKLADLVLWDPIFFGVKPDLILKGGTIVNAHLGEANASIPTTEPRFDRHMFGSFTPSLNSIAFVSQLCLESGSTSQLHLGKQLIAPKNTSSLTKGDLLMNDACPQIDVDSETFQVTIDGNPIPVEPATRLPMTQRYFLF